MKAPVVPPVVVLTLMLAAPAVANPSAPPAAPAHASLAHRQPGQPSNDPAAIGSNRPHRPVRPTLRALGATNPDTLKRAAGIDAARSSTATHNHIHGIPVLLKDNLDTGARVLTSAGSPTTTGRRRQAVPDWLSGCARLVPRSRARAISADEQTSVPAAPAATGAVVLGTPSNLACSTTTPVPHAPDRPPPWQQGNAAITSRQLDACRRHHGPGIHDRLPAG